MALGLVGPENEKGMILTLTAKPRIVPLRQTI